jgi:hypothetical protein
MATNPFAGAGLGAFGNDIKEAQAGASNEYAINKAESEAKIKKGIRSPLTMMLASLIPGSSNTLGIAPPVQNTNSMPTPNAPVVPFLGNTNQTMQMPNPNIYEENKKDELEQRITESRNDWGL